MNSLPRSKASPSTAPSPLNDDTNRNNNGQRSPLPTSPDLRSPREERLLLTSLVTSAQAYNNLGLISSSRFFEHHAHALSPLSAEQKLRLARVHASARNYRQVLHVLRHMFEQHPQRHNDGQQHPMANNASSDEFGEMRLLAAQALYELRKYDECVDLIGDSPQWNRCKPPLQAALCVTKARVYEQQDNVTLAVTWFKRALRADVFCFDAFDSLVNGMLISPDDSKTFINGITSPFVRDTPNIASNGKESQQPANHDPSTPVKTPVPNSNTTSTPALVRDSGELATSWLVSYYRACADNSASLPTYPSCMRNSADMACLKASREFSRLYFGQAVKTLSRLLRNESELSVRAMQIYLASLVELEDRQELFSVAHDLVDRDAKQPVAWLAVAYYYVASGKYDVARRFLRKCTALQHRFIAAWVALGHAFAAQDESDQAMAAYRTAARLFPGAQAPPLFMGMEYARQGGLAQAEYYLSAASTACMHDPAPLHELGVVAYRLGDLNRAAGMFRKALSLWGDVTDCGDDDHRVHHDCGISGVGGGDGRRAAEAQEATLVNLGHCYRRLGCYDKAKQCYRMALTLRPRVHTTCTALAMTLHLAGELSEAVSMYHRALRDCPSDAIANELLERALHDLFEYGEGVHSPNEVYDGADGLNVGEGVVNV